MAKIKIVYGSGSGNTELVCEKVAGLLKGKNHEVSLLKAKLINPKDVGTYDLLIFACPTYGHGELEQYFGRFLARMENEDLDGKLCSIIGLGDPKYDRDYHLESIKIISDFLDKKHAKLVGMPLRISKCPLPLMTGHINRWAMKIDELMRA
jgi:flavodoxin